MVAAGAGENLCVREGLPLAADNTFAGANAQVALTFHAEQTINN